MCLQLSRLTSWRPLRISWWRRSAVAPPSNASSPRRTPRQPGTKRTRPSSLTTASTSSPRRPGHTNWPSWMSTERTSPTTPSRSRVPSQLQNCCWKVSWPIFAWSSTWPGSSGPVILIRITLEWSINFQNIWRRGVDRDLIDNSPSNIFRGCVLLERYHYNSNAVLAAIIVIILSVTFNFILTFKSHQIWYQTMLLSIICNLIPDPLLPSSHS